MDLPKFTNVQQAYQSIKTTIHKTPLLSSSLINEICGCEVYFKCENFQKAGAFKFRGASNAIANLPKDKHKNGVATHSSGNHAGALAKAAASHGIKAYIVMPRTAPQVKVDAVKSYGGIISFCEPTLEAREETLNKVIEETGATFIHPYNNFQVISGQGTACLELTTQMEAPDFVLAPVGGGGLLSGTAITSKTIWPNTIVLGAEPLNANDAWQSFQKREFVPSQNPNTIADGLLTSLGDMTFKIILDKVDDILTVTEEEIKEAQLLIMQRLKIVIEPSSAVPLAAVLSHSKVFKNKRVALILSGGNIDLSSLH